MDHLPGFWNPGNWDDDKWGLYLKRQRKRGAFRTWLDQYLHEWMGVFMPRGAWEKREAKQWPSKTGSYDPCEDHYHWLIGRGQRRAAADLRGKAQAHRPECLA